MFELYFQTFLCNKFQEQAQKDAFEVLQFQKDARNQRITEQIQMIEEELKQNTTLKTKD
jgi:hypothetical protein